MKVTGKAKLIRYTDNPEATIAAAAKLCYSPETVEDIIHKHDNADNAKYIKMLLGLGHLSPFEHASFTFSIEGVSRALLAQITRHRIASFSVRSQRYVNQADFNYVVPPSIEALGADAQKKYAAQMEQMLVWYKEWQDALGGAGEGANEDARFVLPNACGTQMIVTMNARELMHFFELRCCNRAQWEIRSIAWQMLSEVLKVAPNVFMKSGPTCADKACSEGKMSCGKATEIKARRDAIITKINAELDNINALVK